MFTDIRQVLERNSALEKENSALYAKVESLLKETAMLKAAKAKQSSPSKGTPNRTPKKESAPPVAVPNENHSDDVINVNEYIKQNAINQDKIAQLQAAANDAGNKSLQITNNYNEILMLFATLSSFAPQTGDIYEMIEEEDDLDSITSLSFSKQKSCVQTIIRKVKRLAEQNAAAQSEISKNKQTIESQKVKILILENQIKTMNETRHFFDSEREQLNKSMEDLRSSLTSLKQHSVFVPSTPSEAETNIQLREMSSSSPIMKDKS